MKEPVVTVTFSYVCGQLLQMGRDHGPDLCEDGAISMGGILLSWEPEKCMCRCHDRDEPGQQEAR